MGIHFSHVFATVLVSASREIGKTPLTLECFCFPILSPRLEKVLLIWKLIKILYFRSRLHSSIYVKLFTKEINLFWYWAGSSICISDPFVIEISKYIQCRRIDRVFHSSSSIFAIILWISLRIKCPYSELFWSVFSRMRTEYREILRIFPYSVRMRENADQNNSEYGHFSRRAWQYKLVYNRSKWISVEIFLKGFSAAFSTATIKNTHKWLLPKCSFQK